MIQVTPIPRELANGLTFQEKVTTQSGSHARDEKMSRTLQDVRQRAVEVAWPVEVKGLARSRHAMRFGPFKLLPLQRLLLKGDKQVRLDSRALDILIALVERPGQLICNNELMACVCPRHRTGGQWTPGPRHDQRRPLRVSWRTKVRKLAAILLKPDSNVAEGDSVTATKKELAIVGAS